MSSKPGGGDWNHHVTQHLEAELNWQARQQDGGPLQQCGCKEICVTVELAHEVGACMNNW